MELTDRSQCDCEVCILSFGCFCDMPIVHASCYVCAIWYVLATVHSNKVHSAPQSLVRSR